MRSALSPQPALRGRPRLRTGALAGLAAGLLISTACTAGTGAALSSEPVEGLVVDVLSEPDSLDPMYRNTAEAQRYYRLVYSSLLKWNEDKSLAPDLAKGLPQVSEDRLTYTIKLRDDVTFHDGSPLTAKDVVFTYREVADPDNGSVWLSSLERMKSVKATDDSTVQLTLEKPYAYLKSRLAMIPVLPSGEYEPNSTYAKSENGSGPYELEEMSRGDSLVLSRNEDYFGKKPPFESVTFQLVPEDASRVARLLNGESHLVPGIPADQVDLVRERGQHARTVKGNVTRVFFYPSMREGRPTADTDFRLALASAIDRSAIVDKVYDGAGSPNSTYLTKGTDYYDPELGGAFGGKPDLDRARKHLKKSGVELDRKLSIIAFNTPDLVNTATIIQANLKKLGIESKVDIQEIAGIFPKLTNGKYDLILYKSPVTTSSGFAPDYVYGGLHSESANNFAQFGDPEMDRLLEEAITAPSVEQQAAAWRAVQQRDLQTQGTIQVVTAQSSEAWSEQLKNYRPSSLLWLNTLLEAG